MPTRFQIFCNQDLLHFVAKVTDKQLVWIANDYAAMFKRFFFDVCFAIVYVVFYVTVKIEDEVWGNVFVQSEKFDTTSRIAQ